MTAAEKLARLQIRAAIAAEFAEECRDMGDPVDEVIEWQAVSAHISRAARDAYNELRRMDRVLDGILRDARGAT